MLDLLMVEEKEAKKDLHSILLMEQWMENGMDDNSVI
jgi:hypothetical protein